MRVALSTSHSEDDDHYLRDRYLSCSKSDQSVVTD